MNTDIAQLCKVLRSLLKAAHAGEMSKDDFALCGALLSALEQKYEAGVAALEEPKFLDELAELAARGKKNA